MTAQRQSSKSTSPSREDTPSVINNHRSQDSLRTNMLWNSIGGLAYQGCLWLTTILVVILGDGYLDSGVLALAMTVGNMFTAIATYSLRSYQATDVDNKYSQRNYVAFRIFTLAIGVITLVPYSLLLTQDLSTVAGVVAFLFFKTDESFCDVFYGIDQQHERMDYIGKSQLIRAILLITAFTATLAALHSLALSLVAMFICCAAVTFAYDMPHAARFGSIVPSANRHTITRLLLECAPVAIGSLMMTSVVGVARQFYGTAYSMEELGIYAAIATPAVIVQALARFLYYPVLVPLAQKWAQGHIDAFKKQFAKSFLIIATTAFVSLIPLTSAGPPVLFLVYGESISPHTYLFAPALASAAVITLGYFLSDVLIAIRKLKGYALTTASALVSCLIIMNPIESYWGMNGISIATAFATTASIVVSISIIVKTCQHPIG